MFSFGSRTLVGIAAFLCVAAGLIALARQAGLLPFGHDDTLRFRVGAIDPRFGISDTTVIRLAREAAAAWGAPNATALIAYDSTASLVLNLAFDDRQERWLDSRKLRRELLDNDAEARSLGNEFEGRLRIQTERHHDVERRQDELERRRIEHNARVQLWNEKGGAPPDVVADLNAAGASIERDQESLSGEVTALNEYIQETNRLIAAHNALVDKGNDSIRSYTARHDTAATFHKGVYDGGAMTITIFQFEDDDDLRFTMAHEFGHALGFPDTNGDPAAVMHHTIGDQDKRHLRLSREDQRLVTEKFGARE